MCLSLEPAKVTIFADVVLRSDIGTYFTYRYIGTAPHVTELMLIDS